MFVMDAGDAITHELFGDVGQAVAIPLHDLFFAEGLAAADFVDGVHGQVGDAAV